jgi:hypothetical protein
MSNKKIVNTTHTTKRKKGQSNFLQRHFKLFQFAQLEVLIERFGSFRILWEGERKKIIKYVKA